MTTSKIADITSEMDILARAQFFEGYLNVTPFAKTQGKGTSALLKMIEASLLEAGGTPDPLWKSRANTGLYQSAVKVAERIIGSNRSESGADVLQNSMGLAGWVDEEGAKVELGGKSPFWLAGQEIGKSSKDFLSGKLKPIGVAGLASLAVKRRALDVVRKEKTREILRDERSESIIEETYGDTSGQEDWEGVVDGIFSNPTSSISKDFFKWLKGAMPRFMRRSESSNMILSYIEILQQGKVKSDSDAALALGTTSAGISNAKKVFTDSLSGYLDSNPKAHQEVLDLFENSKFYGNLLSGHVQGGRTARLARRVAARFLERTAAKRFKFKKDTTLFSGVFIPKGTPATLDFSETEKKIRTTGVAYVTIVPEGFPQVKNLYSRVETLNKFLDGFPKMPGISSLEKMSDNGIATTPMGERVEPDGFGPSGAPSWLLVAGVI